MADQSRFLSDRASASRRSFLRVGSAGAAALACLSRSSTQAAASGAKEVDDTDPRLTAAIQQLEPYLTTQLTFRDVSRGKPIPHTLPAEKKSEVGLTRDTWKLEVVSDPDQPADLGNPLKQERGTAVDFARLMQLADRHAVRFAKVMTCLNIGCPLGMGIWEGVPLRELVWLTQPTANLRRVFYYGYHNNDPGQMFRSSLPIGRVLEDPFDWPPVIVCYKLNGEWLTSERGGPVRMVVPEAYGFKSIKWLTHIVLSNLSHANDTYASGNNDLDSPLKTFAATQPQPKDARAGEPIPVTGYAQVGMSGLSKVQVWLQSADDTWPRDDPYFSRAPWVDAQILPPPTNWGGGLADGAIPKRTLGFDETTRRPSTWPMRFARAQWAVVLPGQPAGTYVLRSRTIDEKGQAQPMPRPFRKSGHAEIERVRIVVNA